MASFEVLVRPIDDVFDHPNADRLSIVRILGYEAITAKDENGNHRFSTGENIVYVPEQAILPENVLRQYGYWNDEKNTGMLAGKGGSRVKAIRLRNVISQGLVLKLVANDGDTVTIDVDGTLYTKTVGEDVADIFGIEKYEAPIPTSLAGEVASVTEFMFNFDIENEQNFPNFLDNDEVEVTEKLHGTNARIAYRPNVNHPELFGNGDVAISSKGLGAKGLVFKNNEKNVNNLYVRTFTALDLPTKMSVLGQELGMNIDLYGEILGAGVQDLTYGLSKPVFRAFDIAINGTFLSADEKKAMFLRLGVESVPVLYRGPWDRQKMVELRDGKTMFDGANIREGIVVTAIGDQTSRQYMNHRLRPFLKMVSPDYLTRKGETTEFQ